MIYSGLDWSGSPGLEPKSDDLLVLTIVHLDGDDLPRLHDELAAVRERLRLSPGHVFKHLGASAMTQHHFFAAIGRVEARAHVHIIDKSV